MKVIINTCYGRFSVSEAVYHELGLHWNGYGFLNNKTFNIKSQNEHLYRCHPKLIEVIEKIGTKPSSGVHADLRIIKIPNKISWVLYNYLGFETIHEKHRVW